MNIFKNAVALSLSLEANSKNPQEGLIHILVLGVFLASCADDGKNQTYKTAKIIVIAKYENGDAVTGKTLSAVIVQADISRVVKKANEIARNKGISDIEKLDWFIKFDQLFTIIKDVPLDANGRAEVPILTEYGGLKFGNYRDFHFTSGDETKILKNQNISSSPIKITLPNPN